MEEPIPPKTQELKRQTAEIKRGALKMKPDAVARMRVGNSSGSQIGVHEKTPWMKNP